MTTRLITIVIILAVIYGIGSCTIDNYDEKKRVELARKAKERKSIDAINEALEAKGRYNANTYWMEKLGYFDEKKFGVREIYTKDLQDSMLANQPILLIGKIIDIKNANPLEQEIFLELPFELSTRHLTRPKIKFKISCQSSKVESILQDFENGGYRRNSITKIQLTLIVKTTAIEDFSYEGSDGERLRGALVVGECLDILLAPQEFGHVLNNIKKFK